MRKISYECWDCGKVFRVPASATNPACPRCGSSQIYRCGRKKAENKPAANATLEMFMEKEVMP